MSKVELYETIRRQRRDEGASIHELARRHGVHRRTVRQALACATPAPRKTPVRASPALGAYKEVIRGWLEADRLMPRKQRHTARRVWQRLRDECGAEVGESTVRDFVAQVKAELAGAARGVTIPQEHAPGAEAEVDFGEFYAFLAGVKVRLWLFVMRLSHSGRGFAHAFSHQAQEAFFEGHRLAFEHFVGVPGRIRYDNLKDAVTRILLGRDRIENERFVALRSHYGFDSFFCAPGVAGAHEKGGVEGEVGRFRRTHLVPVPHAADLAELNLMLGQAMAADDRRRITGRDQTVGEAYAAEQPALWPLPDEGFDCARLLSCKVDAKARICVLQSWYSVPARLARRTVRVRLGAATVQVCDERGRLVATHARSLHKHTQDLVLDHYLEILVRKPGALPGSTALAQARAQGVFTAAHERFWAAARRKLGDGAGTRALIEVLLIHRRMPADAIIAGIDATLAAGQTDPTLVTICARRHADGHTGQEDGRLADVVELDAARRTGLGGYDRPAPCLDGYDQLLSDTPLAEVVEGEAGS